MIREIVRGGMGRVVEAVDTRLDRTVTITVEGDDCDTKDTALWLRYWVTIAEALKNYPPRAGKVAITLNVTSKAKGMSAAVGKDGSTFVFTGSRDIEPSDWNTQIETAFRKVMRKP